jgi:hypothetical protein
MELDRERFIKKMFSVFEPRKDAMQAFKMLLSQNPDDTVLYTFCFTSVDRMYQLDVISRERWAELMECFENDQYEWYSEMREIFPEERLEQGREWTREKAPIDEQILKWRLEEEGYDPK